MAFNLLKAIRNTHRHPVNRILHCIGLPLYIVGISVIASYIIGQNTNPVNGLVLLIIAISLFLTGHKVEGNLRAMTLIILYKYLKVRIKTIKTKHCYYYP
ncbi:MAG TPA: hypothetical protein VFY64_05960 [Nitrososphaeraceae archaeon]|nr:hypothetical protein [Nitrososphaeraceae archaeon]